MYITSSLSNYNNSYTEWVEHFSFENTIIWIYINYFRMFFFRLFTNPNCVCMSEKHLLVLFEFHCRCHWIWDENILNGSKSFWSLSVTFFSQMCKWMNEWKIKLLVANNDGKDGMKKKNNLCACAEFHSRNFDLMRMANNRRHTHIDTLTVYPQILKEHILKNLYLRIWNSSRIMENNGKSEQNLDVFKEDHHDEWMKFFFGLRPIIHFISSSS